MIDELGRRKAAAHAATLRFLELRLQALEKEIRVLRSRLDAA